MNKVLFLPGMGIQPMEYNSVKASSEAQLLAFDPGPQYVGLEGWYPNALSSMVWNGSAWIPRVPVVETLPADASTHGKRVQYYKYPVVSSLPATVVDGARYVLDATKVEYLGRSVVELEGSDNISLPVLEEYFGNFAEIKVNFRDLVSGGPPTGSRVFLEAVSIVCYVLDTGDFWMDLINTSGYQGSVGVIGVNICDGLNHQLTINFTDTCVFITADGVQSSCITTDGFSYNPITYINVNTADDISPLQICCIQQSVNGTLIDSIPCDESTGTTLRNTVSPDRPATLSDATAHALAWVAQSAPTLTVWGYENLDKHKRTILDVNNYVDALDIVNGSGFNATWYQAIRISKKETTSFRFGIKNSGLSPLVIDGAIVATSDTVNADGTSSVGNAVTEDGTTGWVSVKWNGNSSITIPSGEEIVCDDIPISAIEPVDEGKRIHLIKIASSDWGGLAFKNSFVSDVIVGGGYIDPSTLNPATALSANINYSMVSSVGLTFASPQIVARCFGDSISYGFGSTNGMTSWFDRLPEEIEKVKHAVNGLKSDQYLALFLSKVDENTSLAFYPPFTPNDVGFSDIDTQFERSIDAVEFANSKSALPVLVELCPDDRLDLTQDNERKLLYQMLSNKTIMSIISSVDTGDSPNRFDVGMAVDQVHPSEDGYIALGLEATSWYNESKVGLWKIS